MAITDQLTGHGERGPGPELVHVEDVQWTRPAYVDTGRRRGTPLIYFAIAVVAVAALLGALAWLNRSIETQVESAAREILSSEGINTDELEFTADYRDVRVTGILPTGVPEASIQELLESSTSSDGVSMRMVDMAAERILTPLDVTAALDGRTLTLTGTLPNSDLKEILLAEAEQAGLTVVDEIDVTERDPAASNSSELVEGFAQLIAAGARSGESAQISLNDSGTVGDVVLTDPDDRAAIAGMNLGDVQVELNAGNSVVAMRRGAALTIDGLVENSEEAELFDSLAANGLELMQNVQSLDARTTEHGSAQLRIVRELIARPELFGDYTISLESDELRLTGEIVDPDAEAMLQELLAGADAAGLTVSTELDMLFDLTVGEEINLLQAELDALQDELRENVPFESDSAQLPAQALEILERVAESMERYTRPVVEIGGHTDSRGSQDRNVALSARRAEAVTGELVELGVAQGRLRSQGFGSSEPVADDSTAAGQKANRRVAFVAKESFDA